MPYFRTCRATIAQGTQLCPECGAPTTAEISRSRLATRSRLLPQPKTDRSQPRSGARRTTSQRPRSPRLGLVGLVASLAGLIAPFMGLLGLILSLVAYRQATRYGAARGFAIAGIVVGILSLLIYGLAVLA